MTRPVRSTWRALLSSLGWALLITIAGPQLLAVAVYMMGPPRANPDPTIFVIIAGLTLVPSMMLGIALRRTSRVAAQWDLGGVGLRIFVFMSLVTVAFLASCGLYAVARLVELVWLR